GPAQRFLRAAAAPAQASIDGWRHDRAALEIRARALALCQADAPLAPLGFRALLMLIDEAVIQDRPGLARRALDAASDRVSGATGQVAFLEAEWIRRNATVLALEDRVDEALAEFRRGIALCERQGWYVGFAYVELLVGLGALYAQNSQKQRAGRAFDDALQALAAGGRQRGAAFTRSAFERRNWRRRASCMPIPHSWRDLPAPALADRACRGGAAAPCRHGLHRHHRHHAPAARVRPHAGDAHRDGRGRTARGTCTHARRAARRRLRALANGSASVVRQRVMCALSNRRAARRG